MNPVSIALLGANPAASALYEALSIGAQTKKSSWTPSTKHEVVHKTEWQIVVEIDNKEAERIYSNAIAQIESIWPAIVSYCAPLDARIAEGRAKRLAKHDAAVQKYEEDRKRFDALEKAYRRDLEEWDRKQFMRGPRPVKPQRMYEPPPYSYSSLFDTWTHIEGYEQIRTKLKRKHAVAKIANAPYKITEEEAIEMFGWDNGTRIDEIKSIIFGESK